MTRTHCPDWPSLIAARDTERYAEAWHRALEHLDECAHCRDEAFSFEPTLLFQDLPTVEVERGDIDDMKQAVAAMRRAQPLEGRTVERSAFRSALRAAAFAGIGLAMLLLQGAFDLVPPVAPRVDSRPVEIVAETVATLQPSAPLTEPQTRPLVEEVEPLAGTMIQLVDADLDMVVFYSDLDV